MSEALIRKKIYSTDTNGCLSAWCSFSLRCLFVLFISPLIWYAKRAGRDYHGFATR